MTIHTTILAAALWGVAAQFTGPAAVRAQTGGAVGTLAQRIAAAPADSEVRFSFDAAPGVCGDGDNILVRSVRNGETVTSMRLGSYGTSRAHPREGECVVAPIEVRLARSGRSIREVGVRVGASAQFAGLDLGAVQARTAVDYLLQRATLEQAADHAGERLILAATLADAETWPALLEIARTQQHGKRTRNAAIFHLGQAAAERAVAGLEQVARDRSDDLEVRKTAVFALSQSGGDQAIDALVGLARNHSEPAIRRDAMFWLSRTGHARAIAFFEEVLRGG